MADAQHPEGTRPTIWDRTHKPSETVGSLPVPSLNLCWWCTVHAVCSTFPPIFRRLCELRELFGVDKIRRKKVKALLDRKMVKYDYQASSFHNDRAWGGGSRFGGWGTELLFHCKVITSSLLSCTDFTIRQLPQFPTHHQFFSTASGFS